MSKPQEYGQYLQLEKILNAQDPVSAGTPKPAHDEMLFIITHQSYELWFKQLLYEVHAVTGIMKKPSLNDNSPELQTVVHRLGRCVSILKLLVHQIDIMETMEPMDFLDFRDLLRPASGFQSWQFKQLEARLGLRYAQRFGQEHYLTQLTADKINIVRQAEADSSLLELVNLWLERMPFFREEENWENFQSAAGRGEEHVFWEEYRSLYTQSLADPEKSNLDHFNQVLFPGSGEAGTKEAESGLSWMASRAALFIMLYRGYPILQLPFQLLTQLQDIDEQLSTWRYRHMSMVHRTIGTRVGTGGSSGRDYLKGALDKHYIFKDIARLTSFLIERSRLPGLSREMEKRLGFAH